MTTSEQPMNFKTFRACLLIAFIAFDGLGFARFAFAYFEGNHRYDGQSIVNGVDFKIYRNFPEKWKLVTAGFGSDSEEIGFVYANPAAYAHLQKLKDGRVKGDYPDGAVFGRVVFKAETDARLRTFRRPGSQPEYQLMVRGASKFKSTEGWSFARFDAHGVSLSEEPRSMASSCVACHTLARKEGFVFSQLTQFKVVPKLTLPAERKD